MYYRELENEIIRLSQYFKVLTVTGPRQSGKTTLCKKTFAEYKYINLEDETVVAELEVNRKDFLLRNRKGLIIDEVQNMPELFSDVQVIVDEYDDARFVLTGSNNFLLTQKIMQSLAGRTAVLSLLPLSLSELSDDDRRQGLFEIMLKGLYPAVWAKNIPPQDVYRQYYTTYIQRDIQQVIKIKNLSEFRKFVVLCAARIGTEFNASSLSNELGVSVPTITEWFNVLEASYIVFRLQPFFKNINKRLVKTPKIYFYDVGLVCFLLGINTAHQVETHPLRGSIFENLVVCEFLKKQCNRGLDNNLFFFRDKSQKEVDLIQDFGDEYHAYEIKIAPTINSDFYKNLKYFHSLFPTENTRSTVIYTGNSESQSPETGYINYLNISTL
ncbi:MAG: ATP-binding protein [Bacteroidales bacterium]|nr:ATP-binding protein [Bacteroidales bacterium]